MENRMKTIIAILVIIILGAFAYFIYTMPKSETPSSEAPTGESSASTSPETINEGWLVFSDEAKGISFEYPASLGLNYTDAVDWPPQVNLINEPYACTEAGKPQDRAGATEERTIGGTHYCVTEVREGAAGSTYSQYAYALDAQGKTAILTFTIRTVQCANYDEPKASQCREEQESFDTDSLIERIVRTLKIEG